jgi:outer membrane lipoprotein
MNYRQPIKAFIYPALLGLLSACASQVPVEIREFPNTAPGVAEVRKKPEQFLSEKIRWGGTIAQIENKQQASWLTIIALPLDDDGRPLSSDQSPGRFIAIIDGFLEPEVYSQNRQITVIGNIQKSQTVKIGEFPYEHPVIQVEYHYLWPPEPEPSSLDYYPYRWYDPWYDPWYYPYYPWYGPYYPYHYH